MTEEEWSLNPETMAEIRLEASTGLGLDNGYASTVILEAFDLIETLRGAVAQLQSVCRRDPAYCDACEIVTGSDYCGHEPLKTKCELCASVR